MAEVLFTSNDKGMEAPHFLPVLKLLEERFPAVTLAESPEAVEESRKEASAIWVVFGGDGTLHRVVNSLMRSPAAVRPPVFYYPTGTGNDFARTLGLANREAEALLREALADPHSFREVAVGRCNEHYFVNVATGGIFATITPETSSQWKSLAGSWSYFFQGLSKVMERRTFSLRVNGRDPMEVLGFFVANARFAGGGIQVASGADPFRPKMEFLTVPELTTTALLGLGLELQKEKPSLEAYSPASLQSVEGVDLAFSEEVPINLDGEQVRFRNVRFETVPQAIRIFVPSGS